MFAARGKEHIISHFYFTTEHVLHVCEPGGCAFNILSCNFINYACNENSWVSSPQPGDVACAVLGRKIEGGETYMLVFSLRDQRCRRRFYVILNKKDFLPLSLRKYPSFQAKCWRNSREQWMACF